MRLLVFISAGYVDRISTQRWWYAQCTSPMGRWVQHRGFHLGMAMFSMLFTGDYKHCQLKLAARPTGKDMRFTHAMCQCGLKPQLKQGTSVTTRAHGDVRKLPSWMYTYIDPADGLPKQYQGLGNWTLGQVPWARSSRLIRMPWWVSETMLSKAELIDSNDPPSCICCYIGYYPLGFSQLMHLCNISVCLACF